MLDLLGLPLADHTKALTSGLTIVEYGDAGTGKTTDACLAFPRGYFVSTSPTIMRPYYSLEGTPPLAQVVLPEYNQAGILVDTKGSIDQIIATWLAAGAAKVPYDALIIDEFTEVVRRVYVAIQAASPGKSPYPAMEALTTWVSYVTRVLPQALGKSLVLICHESEPKYHAESSAIKYKGGPMMPLGALRKKLCADADLVLRVTLTDSLQAVGGSRVVRKYWTEANEKYEAKCRDSRIDAIEPLGLAGLLHSIGARDLIKPPAAWAKVQAPAALSLEKKDMK